MRPRKEALDLPASAVAAQVASIPAFAPVAPVGRDPFDSIFRLEMVVERVQVAGLVTDKPRREFIEKASGRNLFHKLALGRRSALHRYRGRKTASRGDSDDVRSHRAKWGRPRGPFLALAKIASTNAASRSRFSCPAHADVAPAALTPAPPFRSESTAGIDGGRSGTAATSPVIHANVLRCRAPRTRHSVLRACHAMDVHGCPLAARAAAQVPPPPCSSFSSQRPAIGAIRRSQSKPGISRNCRSAIYETGSGAL